MSETSSQLIQTETDGTVQTIELNRPDKLNAVNDPLLEAFHEVLTDAHERPAEAILLTGAGRATCAGRDEAVVSRDDYERHELTDELPELLRSYPKPTAIAGRGALVGMAFSWSLACDFVILGEETHFAYPEIQYDIDTSDSLERVAEYVGPRVAKEIMMTGDSIDPEHAYELGLVNDVVPEAEVENRARELLEQIASHDETIIENMLASSRMPE